MDISAYREETLSMLLILDLMRHEGYKEYIYLDSVNEKTFGVGHLVTSEDPEYDKPVGTRVSPWRIAECLNQDIQQAYRDMRNIFGKNTAMPLDVARVMINMAFNLGYTRLSKFKRMIAAVKRADYKDAAKEMVDSKWYHQVGRRAEELVEIMEYIASRDPDYTVAIRGD